MSCVTKRSLSIPVRSAGAIQIAPTPGIWWLQWSVHSPVPLSYSTSAPAHSSGVDVAPLEDALPDDVRACVVMEHGVVLQRLLGVDEHRQRLVLDLDQVGGV